MASSRVVENSTEISFEAWFIPLDIIMMTCNISSILLATLLLVLTILDKAYRKVPMLLVGNSCLATLMFGSSMLITTSFGLDKDIKDI